MCYGMEQSSKTEHIHNSIVHCNSIVRLVANRALHCARSPMGANVA